MTYLCPDVLKAMHEWDKANEDWETAMEANGWVEVETQDEPPIRLDHVVPNVPPAEMPTGVSFVCHRCGALVVDSKSCPCMWTPLALRERCEDLREKVRALEEANDEAAIRIHILETKIRGARCGAIRALNRIGTAALDIANSFVVESTDEEDHTVYVGDLL